MASRIITKKGSGAPLASDLVHGELAVDTVNKRLYTENAGGTIIELGTAPSTIDINAGTIDGTVIGGSSAAAGTFTSITGTSANINGTVTADGLTVGDGHTIGDDAFDNLLIQTSSGEGIRLVDNHATNSLSVESNVGFVSKTLAGTSRFLVDNATGDISFYKSDGSTTGVLWDASASTLDVTGTVTADGLTVDGSGTLQLNAASTTDFFTIAQGGTTAVLTADSPDGAGNMVFKTAAAGVDYSRMLIGSSGDISFYEDTGTTAKFFWDASAESLGIGTTSPQEELHIEANYPQLRIASNLNVLGSNNLVATVDGYATNGLAWRIGRVFGSADMQISNERSSAITFATGGSERMRIDSSGNVGIGTTSPGAALEVNSAIRLKDATTAAGFDLISIAGDGYVFNRDVGKSLILATQATERMRIDSSGNLLVNTSSGLTFGDAKLQVKGATVGWGATFESDATTSNYGSASFVVANTNANLARFYYSSTGTIVGNVTTNGTSTTYGTTSDERLKENIVDTTHTVDINDIKVRQFDWKVNGDHQRYGFIAQELEAVYPEAVFSPEDPEEMKSVDYSKLVPLLVKEIQDLKAEVAALKGA